MGVPIERLRGLSRARIDEHGSAVVELARLDAARVAVAESWVVSASCFSEAVRNELPAGHDPASLLRAGWSLPTASKAARAAVRLEAAPLSSVLTDALGPIVQSLEAGDLLLVSASPTCAADLARIAGLDAAFVAQDVATLAAAIRALWAAPFAEDALRSLRANRVRRAQMAVLVQRLRSPTHSGFLRSGEATGRGFVAELAPGLASVLGQRTPRGTALRFDHDGRALAEPVLVDAESPLLTEECREQLSRLVVELSRVSDVSRFVRVVWDGRQLVACRVGPAFGAALPAGGRSDTVWSRLWLDDLAPEVTTELSASLLERATRRLVGQLLEQRSARRQRLIGTLHGRIYLNLSLLAPPLAARLRLSSEDVVALASGVAARTLAQQAAGSRRQLITVPVTAARLWVEQRSLRAELEELEVEARRQHEWFAELDLAILPDDGLSRTLLDGARAVEHSGELLARATLGQLTAEHTLETALAHAWPQAPAPLIRQLVATANGSAPVAVLRALARGDTGASAQLADRGGLELELGTPRLSEFPARLVTLATALGADARSRLEARLMAARVTADEALAQLEEQVDDVTFLLLRALVERTRELTELRERALSWLAAAAGRLRTVALDADRRLRRLDATSPLLGVFHARFEELVVALDSASADLGPLLSARAAAHERHRLRPDVPRSFLGAPPALPYVPLRAHRIDGQAASWGVAEGPAVVLSDDRGLEAAEPGSVLVVHRADAHTSLALARVGALVADRGGRHSPVAVAARALGVPAVLGAAGASGLIRDGEWLRVDANVGRVERLDFGGRRSGGDAGPR